MADTASPRLPGREHLAPLLETLTRQINRYMRYITFCSIGFFFSACSCTRVLTLLATKPRLDLRSC